VCRDLRCDFQRTVSVELFADQESLDRLGMNPRMRGSYAYSGDGRIQMVSPRNPVPNLPVGYETRVLIAVHELAHLVLNEVNPRLPLWLNEGVATFVGPHAPYSFVCRNRFPFDRVPQLRDLQQSYATVPAADLFAFTVVDFIVAEYGMDALNRLIRAPDALEQIAGGDLAEFERRWRAFMEQRYMSK
jgi:RNA polymerase sigma-70 factor, ECF subfamily